MSIWSKIGGWFHKQETAIEKVFAEIEPIIVQAEPIVAEISNVVGAVAGVEHNDVLTKVAGYLGTVSTDTAAVSNFVQTNQGVPVPNLLHNAAVLATSLTPAGAAAPLKNLDLAVQTAFNVLAHNNTIASGATPVAAIAAAKPAPQK